MSPTGSIGSVELTMPLLAEGMHDGTILAWMKGAGDRVESGEDLVEIETDKASLVWAAPAGGFLDPLAAVGDTVAVGELIALLHASADAVGRRAQAPPAAAPSGVADSAAAPVPPSELAAAVPCAHVPGRPADQGGDAPSGAANGGGRRRIQASPLARRMAQASGIDLGTLSGTARGGRIVRADVQAAVAGGAGASERATPASQPPADHLTGVAAIHRLSRAESLIAARMAEAKSSIPEFVIAVEVEFDAVLALREQLRRPQDGPAPSVNDIVVKACAVALRRHPRVNAAYRDGTFEFYPRVNIGIAVAAGDMLAVPTILDADRRSLAEIAAQTRDLAARVREGTVTPAQLSGGTFTISNLGMFGMTRFTPIIHAGQAGILGVGVATARMVPAPGGSPVARQIAELTLTGDHRILYGAHAAAFLAELRDLLQAPAQLLW